MNYAVPVFVTDSAPSSCGEQRSGAAIVGTPEASASVRIRTKGTSAALVAHIAANPGSTARNLARIFANTPKSMGGRLIELRNKGFVRSESAAHGVALKWFVTDKPYAKGTRGHEWPAEQLEALQRLWYLGTWDEIFAAIPRSRNAIWEQARRLKLKRRRNIGRDMIALQLARNPKTANVKVPPVTAPTVVRKAIARMTPLEAAWMGRLA